MYIKGAFFCYALLRKKAKGRFYMLNGINSTNALMNYSCMPYPGTLPSVPIKDTPLSIVGVSGIEGARAFPMLPNKTVPLFDNSADLLYIKATDGAGYPTITVFDISRHAEPQSNTEFVTRQEFEELKGMLSNDLNKSSGSSTTTTAKSKSAADK